MSERSARVEHEWPPGCGDRTCPHKTCLLAYAHPLGATCVSTQWESFLHRLRCRPSSLSLANCVPRQVCAEVRFVTRHVRVSGMGWGCGQTDPRAKPAPTAEVARGRVCGDAIPTKKASCWLLVEGGGGASAREGSVCLPARCLQRPLQTVQMAPTRPSKERAQCGACVFLVVGGLVLAALLSFELFVIRASDHGAAVEVSGASTPTTDRVQSGMTSWGSLQRPRRVFRLTCRSVQNPRAKISDSRRVRAVVWLASFVRLSDTPALARCTVTASE